MTVRVSMDVSFAAGESGMDARVTGVGRVITELFKRLIDYQGIDLKAIGCFGGDWNPISTSLNAQRWALATSHRPQTSTPAFKSRLGIARALGAYQVDLESKWKGCGSHSAARRLGLRVLRRIVKFDAQPNITAGNTDLFFSTFRPMPAHLPAAIPRLVFVHDMYPLRFPESCGPATTGNLRAQIAGLRENRDVVLANSHFTKQDFCQMTGFPAESVVVCPLAADEAFHPVTDPTLIDQVRLQYRLGMHPYVLSVANPQPRKNVETAIRAFAQLVLTMPQWNGILVMAGNPRAGWGLETIESVIAQQADLKARIKWIGEVSERDLPALYAGAEAFVFPSLFEGFGLPVLEAMQCGTPVVCSNSTSLPEVAGNAGMLCDPTDVPAFARALGKIVSSPQLRSELSAAGLKQSNSYNWDNTANCVVSAIELAVS